MSQLIHLKHYDAGKLFGFQVEDLEAKRQAIEIISLKKLNKKGKSSF